MIYLYDYDHNVQKKYHKFEYLSGTTILTLKGKTRPETQLKFYKMIAVPTLLYSSEIWTLSSKDFSRIQAAEIKFFRFVKGYTILDKVRNEDVHKELKIFCIKDKIQNSLDHV